MVIRGQSGVPGSSGVPGGQIGMIQLARALTRQGVEVDLFVGGPRMRHLDGLNDVKPAYFRWPHWLDRLVALAPASVGAAAARYRRRRWMHSVASLPGIGSADVVHIQGIEDTEAALARLTGWLVVTHWGRTRRWLPTGSKPEDTALRQRLQWIRERVTVVAIGEAQGEALAAAGIPPDAVIPPGVDRARFRPGDRAEAGRRLCLAGDDRIVLYVGRLAADKNVGTLLEAFAHLPRRVTPARLLVVGDGPMRAELERMAVRLGIGAMTTFRRFVSHQDLPLYYRAANVTVVPSDRLETFCMVALEAIACDCPLIVTDQVPEIVRRFPIVPSVEPYDVDGLSRQIAGALEGDLRPAGSERLADYDWEQVACRYVDLYRAARRRRQAET